VLSTKASGDTAGQETPPRFNRSTLPATRHNDPHAIVYRPNPDALVTSRTDNTGIAVKLGERNDHITITRAAGCPLQVTSFEATLVDGHIEFKTVESAGPRKRKRLSEADLEPLREVKRPKASGLLDVEDVQSSEMIASALSSTATVGACVQVRTALMLTWVCY